MIRYLFTVVAFVFLSFGFSGVAAADTRDVYTITDIKVDETASSVIEARQKAMDAAKLIGARELIRKITAGGGTPVDMALANQFAAAVDVQEEVAGANRYRGTLSVVFNPRTVRAHLDSAGVSYVDRQGPMGLFVPVGSGGEFNRWLDTLESGDKYGLSPFVTALGIYDRSASWQDLQQEAAALGARRGIIGELTGLPGAYRVRLSAVTAAGTQALGTTNPAATLQDTNRAVSAYLGEIWKRSAVVDKSGGNRIQQVTVLYTSLAEWNTLRGSIARSPLVSDFKINAVARDGALVTFAYAGGSDRLSSDFLQRGIALERQGAMTIVRSATSGLR